MASGNGTTSLNVPTTTGAYSTLRETTTSPSAGSVTAGVINLRGKDTQF